MTLDLTTSCVLLFIIYRLGYNILILIMETLMLPITAKVIILSVRAVVVEDDEVGS